MTTESAAKKIFRTWRITNHCREQMAERGIAPSELIECMMHHDPEQSLEGGGYVVYNGKIGLPYYYKVDVDTGDTIKLVVTVLLANTAKRNWEWKAVEMAPVRSVDAYDVDEMLAWAQDKTAATEPKYRARSKPKIKVAPVQVRNAYDGVPHGMMATARRLLRASGLDPQDLRPVVVLGPGRIEIDPTRLQRAS